MVIVAHRSYFERVIFDCTRWLHGSICTWRAHGDRNAPLIFRTAVGSFALRDLCYLSRRRRYDHRELWMIHSCKQYSLSNLCSFNRLYLSRARPFKETSHWPIINIKNWYFVALASFRLVPPTGRKKSHWFPTSTSTAVSISSLHASPPVSKTPKTQPNRLLEACPVWVRCPKREW